jgi:hypothetical protein
VIKLATKSFIYIVNKFKGVRKLSNLKNLDELLLLEVGDFFVKARRFDNYIDCLPLFNSLNKTFYSWYRNKRTIAFLVEFYATKKLNELGSIIKELGPRYGKHISIWVHPQIFIQMVQSVIPKYELLVTDWVLTIHKQGFVEVRDELIKKNREYDQLAIKHKNLLRKRNYHKLMKGCCVYLRTTDASSLVFKLGSTQNMGLIMAEARRHYSKGLVVYCVYLRAEHYKTLEQFMLAKWESFLVSPNHEQLISLDLGKAILDLTEVLSVMGVPYTLASTESLEGTNKDV